MKQYTFDFFYWYKGGDEKDFINETITSDSYSKAVEILKEKYGKVKIEKSIMKP